VRINPSLPHFGEIVAIRKLTVRLPNENPANDIHESNKSLLKQTVDRYCKDEYQKVLLPKKVISGNFTACSIASPWLEKTHNVDVYSLFSDKSKAEDEPCFTALNAPSDNESKVAQAKQIFSNFCANKGYPYISSVTLSAKPRSSTTWQG
jgi:hypothetical protein